VEYNCALIKVDLLDACIAIRVVGAVFRVVDPDPDPDPYWIRIHSEACIRICFRIKFVAVSVSTEGKNDPKK
jgi:hypothetical protein